MKKINKVRKAGFTLIEMVLVIAIIVIMASIGWISWQTTWTRSQSASARDSEKFMHQMQSQADYVRLSMLSGTPAFATST